MIVSTITILAPHVSPLKPPILLPIIFGILQLTKKPINKSIRLRLKMSLDSTENKL